MKLQYFVVTIGPFNIRTSKQMYKSFEFKNPIVLEQRTLYSWDQRENLRISSGFHTQHFQFKIISF